MTDEAPSSSAAPYLVESVPFGTCTTPGRLK